LYSKKKQNIKRELPTFSYRTFIHSLVDFVKKIVDRQSKGEDANKEIPEDISEEEFRIAEYDVLGPKRQKCRY
jgi:hypothetical protein